MTGERWRKKTDRGSTVRQKNITQATKHLKKPGAVCHLCGKIIDITLKKPDPNAFTIDHVIPVQHGGREQDNMRPAHAHCNYSRGIKPIPNWRTGAWKD